MHLDLDAIVAADEEARSRVTVAEQRHERDAAAARAARDAAITARSAAASESLDSELEAIRAEGDARLERLRSEQSQYLATLAEAGERNLDEAVRQYLRIVCAPAEEAE
jgi:hypothetical protein